jgi:hypothetical protein
MIGLTRNPAVIKWPSIRTAPTKTALPERALQTLLERTEFRRIWRASSWQTALHHLQWQCFRNDLEVGKSVLEIVGK